MKLYLVSSVNPQGYTVTTRHVSPMGVATETLRRSLAGHIGIVVQEGPLPCEPERPKARLMPLPQRRGGASD